MFTRITLFLIILISAVLSITEFEFTINANSDQCIYEYFSDNTLIIYDIKATSTSGLGER